MKKLLITMSVLAVALGARAEFTAHTAGFETMAAGDTVANDTPESDSQTIYWSEEATDSENTVTAYTDNVPSFTDKTAGNNFLAVDSSTGLFRNFNAKDVDVFAPQAIGGGLFVDTMVQFTPADTAPTPDSADKLIVWVQEVEADEAQGTDAATNLVVTAGYYGETGFTSKDFVLDVGDDFGFLDWHRLTIKAIEDAGTGAAGFVVYVDGVALGVPADDKDGYLGDLDGYEIELSTLGAKYNAQGQLFLSLLDANNDANPTSLTAVGFKGTGKIDDLELTDVAPTFAADALTFTLTWTPAEVASITVNEDALTPEELAIGSKVYVDLAPGAEFTVVATYAAGYMAGEWDGDVKVTSPTTLAITAVPAQFEVNGTAYATFAEAVENATAGDTIKLLTDVTLDEDVLGIEQDMVLDLAGNDLAAELGDNPAIIVSGASLTIIDSVGGGAISAESGVAVQNDGEATLVVGAATGDEGATIGGLIIVDEDCEFSIIKGIFPDADEEGVFAYADAVDGDSEAKFADDVWTVAPKSGDDPALTKIAVPTAVEEELVYDGTEQTGVVAGTGYTLTGNTATGAGDYTATATLEAGYAWTDGSTEAATINWSIAKAEVNVTPNSTSKKYGEDDPAFIAQVDGVIDGEKLNYTLTREEGEDVGEYDITVELGDNPNYAVNSYTGTFTIEAASVTPAIMLSPASADWASDLEFPTVTVTGYTADDYDVAWDPAELPAENPAQDTDFTVTVTMKGNYSGSNTATFTVKPAAAPTPEWDIPGVEGGINGIDVGEGKKEVEFTSIAIVDGEITVDLKAAKIDADGQTFGLICKDDLTSETTFVVNATLAAEKDATAGTFTADLPEGKDALFVIGVGPAAKE